MQLWHQRMWYMHFDFTRKCCYAFWLHQQTLLCILTSPANTAMHSDFTRKHCYAFWHHQKTLLLLKCYAMSWLQQKTLLCILTSPENTAMHSDITRKHCYYWSAMQCSDFSRKHCYAFWHHQKTLLCILTSPENTAMHSDIARKHCYAFWHHQKTLLCILISSHTGPICKLNPPTRPLLCTAMSLKQRSLQWMSLLHKSHQWNCFNTMDFLHEKQQNGHTTQSWWNIINSCRESCVHVSMQFLLQDQTATTQNWSRKKNYRSKCVVLGV